jgi:CheY-like chemotaxis protein/phosphoribosyl 1,2-cyclic phosphodiesterase
MRARFWGTRGSIAKASAATLRYGGNTSCVEVRADDGTLVVLDAGTGIHELGLDLMGAGAGERGSLLIGHTHWDHIQGFPFFAPFFSAGAAWDVYAPGGRGHQIEASLATLMSPEHHPIELDELEASVRFQDLAEGEFMIGSIRVITQYLHHPALTLGYRFEADGQTLVYATDHEPHSLHPLSGGPGARPLHHEDRRHVRFLEGADLVIHDSQYTLHDFPARTGWGHAPAERAVDYAIAAGVRRLALFHHDPEHDDGTVDAIASRAGEWAAQARHSPEVFAAAEGQSIDLAVGAPVGGNAARSGSALVTDEPRTPSGVLIVEDDPDMRALIRATLDDPGLKVWSAGASAEALRMLRTERPSLVVLDRNLPDGDGLDICRAVRTGPDEELRDVPILILTGDAPDEGGLAEAFTAGATDFLIKPIKPALLRARVKGWLLRQ